MCHQCFQSHLNPQRKHSPDHSVSGCSPRRARPLGRTIEVFVASRDDDADYRNAVAQKASLHIVLPQEKRFLPTPSSTGLISTLPEYARRLLRHCVRCTVMVLHEGTHDAPMPSCLCFTRNQTGGEMKTVLESYVDSEWRDIVTALRFDADSQLSRLTLA